MLYDRTTTANEVSALSSEMRKLLLLLSLGVTFCGSIVFCQKTNAGANVPLTDAQKLKIVETHNKIRRRKYSSNMRYMTWDGELAWFAESYGRRCRYRHNKYTKHTKYASVGENMYASTKKLDDFVVTAPISKWNSEASNFYYFTRTCRGGKECKHYTQVVWASTFKVGCGLTTCDFLSDIHYWNSIFFICYYATAGNLVSEPDKKLMPVYEKGLACSKCDKGDYCRNRLCANSKRDFIKPPDDAQEKVFTGYIAGIAVLSVLVVSLSAWIVMRALRKNSCKLNRCCWSKRLRDVTSRRNTEPAIPPRPALRSLTEVEVSPADHSSMPLFPRRPNKLEVNTDSYGTTPLTEIVKTPRAGDKLPLKRTSGVCLPKPNHPAPRSPPPSMPAPKLTRP